VSPSSSKSSKLRGHSYHPASIATDLASPTADVIALSMVTKHEATNASAVDVVAKPAKVAKVKRARRKAATLTSNDSKLLNYLVGVLKGRDSVVIAGSKMAAGSGLPLGSFEPGH
jgi:hypothetical protein